MAEFLTTTHLNAAISDLIEQADQYIILISPFIKFHPNIKSLLAVKKENPKLQLTVVFGKNENDLKKSISHEDLEFLKTFPNVQIRYEKRLHAKYYANDFFSILTSMNLYDYSQNNNIEFGVLYKPKIIGKSIDEEAIEYFEKVIKQSDLLFKTEPEFDEGNMIGLNKKYKESKIMINNLDDENIIITETNQLSDFGYCIRTGEKIPLDVKMPFSTKAFESWNRFQKEDYPEKYCHLTGEPSNGETSFVKPFMKKNFKKAMNIIDRNRL